MRGNAGLPQGDRQELESLLQYFERAPVSLKRLEYLDDGRVLYRGTRFHPGLGRDHQLVNGLEFLAMLVPHIALRYECQIFSYGALSTRIRRQLGWVDRKGGAECDSDREAAGLAHCDGSRRTADAAGRYGGRWDEERAKKPVEKVQPLYMAPVAQAYWRAAA